MFKILYIFILFSVGCTSGQPKKSYVVKSSRGNSCFINPESLVQGLSKSQQHLVQTGDWHIIYNNQHRNPDLVIYSMKFDPAEYLIRRKSYSNKFITDERVAHSAHDQHYAKSGYDKGHMAPAKDFSYSKEAALSTFLYSNIAPQTAILNRKIWRKYEEYFRDWSCGHNTTIQILTGSLYKKHERTPKLKSDSSAPSIPDAFYKIVLVESDDGQKCNGIVIVEDNHSPNKETFENIYSISDFSNNFGVWYESELPIHAHFSKNYWQNKGSLCANSKKRRLKN